MMRKITHVTASFLAAALLAAVPSAGAAEPVRIAWSVWTGWMPFKLMDKEGLLKKRSAELGVEVELVEFKGYMDSVQAFAAGKVDGCAMTAMEALQPASSGVPTVAVLVNDVSNGGDGVLVRKGMKIEDLKGQRVLLEQFSVSHYLLTRALDKAGMVEGDVTVVNIPGDDAGKAFLTDDSVTAVTTWNPHLFLAQESGKGEVIFDSSKIPGEIVDLLVVNGNSLEKNPKAVEAVVLAWYDAMEMITNPATRESAIAIMAEGAGATPKEFEKMLGGTILHTDARQAAAFMASPELVATMGRIKKFSVQQGLITDGDFEVGFGSGSKAGLVFNPWLMEKVAAAQGGAAKDKATEAWKASAPPTPKPKRPAGEKPAAKKPNEKPADTKKAQPTPTPAPAGGMM